LRSTIALHFDREAHGIDDAAELDDAAVAGAFDDAAMMHGDERVDQVAAERPEPRQNSIFVRTRQPAIADHIRDEDRRNFPGFGHGPPSCVMQNSTRKA
jgi:hypothetical protein